MVDLGKTHAREAKGSALPSSINIRSSGGTVVRLAQFYDVVLEHSASEALK